MTPTELYDLTADALKITGPIEWDSLDEPGRTEVLTILPPERETDEPVWGFVSTEGEEFLIPSEQAMIFIKEHLCEWLLVRAWQVQVSVRQGKWRWRLVDCLAVTEGGGDRLEIEPPGGNDELTVLCDSVVLLDDGPCLRLVTEEHER